MFIVTLLLKKVVIIGGEISSYFQFKSCESQL